MECIFLNSAGTTLFVRNDMESGHWVQEQMNVTASFPYDKNKVIQYGQRIAFRDPATDVLQVFEIVNIQNHEPDHYQQITADHICVTELSDEHIDKTEITDKTAAQALGTALTGTLWSVGTVTAAGAQSADFSRGSVWDAVNTIQKNWNVIITPRVTISSAGAITGRYLDVAAGSGVFRGLRLSVRKNLIDPVVTYDDSEVYTALYGYGGSVDVSQTSGDDKTEELTFKDVVWEAEPWHPAKPANQTYLEWPEKTAIYGRNGRPRYGYYQNANIKDANVLLEKTWESLQQSCEPKISISGTCVDLYRLGYKDQPIRLQDRAIVEIEETGELLYRQVICNDVDLVDPSGTRVEIGDYVPNIVYINRETNKKASGGGGGGSGRGSMTNLEDDDVKTFTEFIKTQNQVGMVVGLRNGDNYIRAGQIILAINETGESGSYESAAYINADHINISATNTVHTLAGDIYHDETGKLVVKDGVGLYAEHTVGGSVAKFGVFDDNTLTGGICATKINGETGVYVNGDHVNISGTSTAQTLAGAMERDSSGHLVIKEGAGLYAEHTSGGSVAKFGVFDNHNLTGGICVSKINGQSGTVLKLSADVIDIDGVVSAMAAEYVSVAEFAVTGTSEFGDSIEVYGNVSASGNITASADGTISGGTCSCTTLDADNIKAGATSHAISWKAQSVCYDVDGQWTSSKHWADTDGGTAYTGSLVYNILPHNTTIHYLGY